MRFFRWGKGDSRSLGGSVQVAVDQETDDDYLPLLPGPRLPPIPSVREPRLSDVLDLKVGVHPSLDLYWEPDSGPGGCWRVMAQRQHSERVEAGRRKLIAYARWPEGATRLMWRQAAMMAEGWGILHVVERWEFGYADVRETARLFYISEAKLRAVWARLEQGSELEQQERIEAKRARLRDYNDTEGKDKWHRVMRGRGHFAHGNPSPSGVLPQ